MIIGYQLAHSKFGPIQLADIAHYMLRNILGLHQQGHYSVRPAWAILSPMVFHCRTRMTACGTEYA